MGYLAQNFTPQPVDLNLVAQECARISKIIADSIKPEKIILFGSAADGSFKADSDLDLLIVISNDSDLKSIRLTLAHAKIKPLWEGDYLFATVDRYEQMKNIGGPIYMAHNFGKVLYDQRTAI